MFNHLLSKLPIIRWRILVPTLMLIFFNVGNYWSAHWYSKWSLIVFLMGLSYAWWFAEVTSWFLFPITLWLLSSCAYIGVWQFNDYVNTKPLVELLALKHDALYAWIQVAGCMALVAWMSRRQFASIWRALGLVQILSLGLTLIQEFFIHSPHIGAWSGNDSMNGCLLAALWPFTVGKSAHWNIAVFCLTALAIFKIDASIPIGIFGVVVGVSIFKAWLEMRVSLPKFAIMRSWWVPTLTLFLLAVGVVAAADLSQGSKLLVDSGRFHIWKIAFTWWKSNVTQWRGTGGGTLMFILPGVQEQVNSKDGGYFMWLHNEYFQVLFEYGWAGLGSMMLAVGYVGVKAFKKWEIFAGYVGFLAMATVNYPFRLPIHAMALVVIVSLSLSTSLRSRHLR